MPKISKREIYPGPIESGRDGELKPPKSNNVKIQRKTTKVDSPKVSAGFDSDRIPWTREELSATIDAYLFKIEEETRHFRDRVRFRY